MPPAYSQIALDIAMRIARGEIKEKSKIYGRSVMSSEYGVSPETIRRSMKLLEDMKIVEVVKNSGTIVLSAENAKVYVERFRDHNSICNMQKKLNELIKQSESINKQVLEVTGSMVRMNGRFSESNPFYNHEIEIPKESQIIEKTLVELNFWQETRATVIAVRREDRIILSPGPYVVFHEDDIIIFVGDMASVQAVHEFINKAKSE